MSNKELSIFKEKLHMYNSMFGHDFIPHRDILVEDDKRQHCIQLMQKSCDEKHDYVAEYYNIDVEHMKKHYNRIID